MTNRTTTEPFGISGGRLSPDERRASFAPSPPRHRLDAIGARRTWLWPIASTDTTAEVDALCVALRLHGITGLVPQEGAKGIAWAIRWGASVRLHGLDLVIGLGYLTAQIVCDAIAAAKAGHAAGVMHDQEAWHSVPDSDALCRAVLAVHPDAADWCADCHYPCLTTVGAHGPHTGHDKIARAWAPVSGLRAPQCYWEGSPAPDGFVRDRLAWARLDYPRAGGSPAERVRASVQLYRRSVADHVTLLLAEGETGSVWLWDWREADASARLALRIVHALDVAGYRGLTVSAVERYQLDHGLVADGVVGPATCTALGLEVPAGVRWRS